MCIVPHLTYLHTIKVWITARAGPFLAISCQAWGWRASNKVVKWFPGCLLMVVPLVTANCWPTFLGGWLFPLGPLVLPCPLLSGPPPSIPNSVDGENGDLLQTPSLTLSEAFSNPCACAASCTSTWAHLCTLFHFVFRIVHEYTSTHTHPHTDLQYNLTERDI